MENVKISFRHWLTFILIGLVGQFAWTIENMYLNRYLFYASGSIDMVPTMVAASAITATLTTLLIGALSDRLGKRKPFIVGGYIIWGLSIIGFAFLDPAQFAFLNLSTFTTGVLIVTLDCVMTFFGSSANDASFNAYVTDNTNTNNRGKVESVLSILPLVSMLIIFGLFNGLTTKTEDSPARWDIFFYIFGGITLLIGVLSIFIIPKDVCTPNKEENYFKNIIYGFRPKVIKQNPMLYITLIAFMLFSMAIQVFFPYFLIYIEQNLKIQGLDFTITLGSVLLVSCLITVVFGLFMDKIGKNKVLIPAIITTSVGAILMFISKDMGAIIPSGIVMMSGLMISTAALGAKVREYTPEKEVGLFQGIRMIFTVLIPMVTGPFIGEALYQNVVVDKYTNEFGELVTIPNEYIFLGAAIVMLFAIAPIVFIILKERKNGKKHTA